MNNTDEDYNEDQQVFTVSDEHSDFSNRSNSTSYNYKFNEQESWSLAKAIATAFIILVIISGIAKSADSNSSKVATFFGISVIVISVFLYTLFKSAKNYKNKLERDTISFQNRSTNLKKNYTTSKPKSNRKKFNNIDEYKQTAQYKIDQQNETQKNEINIAVKALISLGFKIKRAEDLVSRAIKSGIVSSDTQALIKYALSNNNKA